MAEVTKEKVYGSSGVANEVIPLGGGWEEMAGRQVDWNVYGAIAQTTRCTSLQLYQSGIAEIE